MKNIRIEHNGLVLDIPANELAEQLANQNLTPQTLWTPITGEESLPTDDEALCLFVELDQHFNILNTGFYEKWGVIKNDIPIFGCTHYTILTKAVK